MQEAIDEVSKEAVKKLKQTSPVGNGPKAGQYKKNWTRELNKGRLSYGAVIYGKAPTYRLAHLLWKGHQIKRNGHVVGSAGAVHDIAAVNDWAIDECIDRVIEKMEALP